MKRLCMLMSLLLCMALPQGARADAPVYARIVMPLFFETRIPEDIHLIQEEARRISQAKIGASIELVPLLYLYDMPDPLRLAELEMLSKQGINIDIYPSMVPNLEPLPLDDLLAQYGQDILALLESLPRVPTGDAPTYRLRSVNDYVSTAGIAMRKDIVEKYAIDISQINTLADLDAVFSHISRHEPGLKMISPYQTRDSLVWRFQNPTAVSSTFMNVSDGDQALLVNYYATDQYRESIALVRKWHEAGYLPEHLILQNIRASQLVNTGLLFSYVCAYKPGIEFEESQSCGLPMVVVSLQAPIITQLTLSMTTWAISSACANPGKAMQALNLLYSDSEMVNLLMYGIEGLHYAVLDDGTIGYPDGITAETVGYQNTMSWHLPNQMVGHVWTGNAPTLWADLRAFNQSAPVSGILSFVFDDRPVARESTQVSAVLDKYTYGLETGQLDPSVYLPRMLQEMEGAGASLVLAEAQMQYSQFLAERE